MENLTIVIFWIIIIYIIYNYVKVKIVKTKPIGSFHHAYIFSQEGELLNGIMDIQNDFSLVFYSNNKLSIIHYVQGKIVNEYEYSNFVDNRRFILFDKLNLIEKKSNTPIKFIKGDGYFIFKNKVNGNSICFCNSSTTILLLDRNLIKQL